MARIFITGSTDGLGRAAAQALIEKGHDVVLHARSPERAAALDELAPRSAGVVIGDLSSATDTRHVAEQVNAIGRMDAVIHNAGAYSTKGRSPTAEGHPTIIAVNTLAPYLLTALERQPGVFRQQALSDCTGLAVARRWPDVLSNAVDPGWSRRRWAGRVRRTISKRDISRKHGLLWAKIPRQLSAADTGITVDRSPRPRKWKTQSFKTSSPPGSLK